jgi:hypothetical protein
MIGTTSSPRGTARLPPGMNEFCTSVTMRAGQVGHAQRSGLHVEWMPPPEIVRGPAGRSCAILAESVQE